MNILQMREKLKSIIDTKRYLHSVNVEDTSLALATYHQADLEKAKIAGLLHDCGKNITAEEIRYMNIDISVIPENILSYNELIHGHVGSLIAKKVFEIDDDDILNAIKWHTTGRENMSIIEKIVYVADYIEPARSFDGVETLRTAAYEDIDKCILLCTETTIEEVMRKKKLIHPNTVLLRNEAIKKLTSKNKLI